MLLSHKHTWLLPGACLYTGKKLICSCLSASETYESGYFMSLEKRWLDLERFQLQQKQIPGSWMKPPCGLCLRLLCRQIRRDGFPELRQRKGIHFSVFASLFLIFGSPLPITVSNAGLLEDVHSCIFRSTGSFQKI